MELKLLHEEASFCTQDCFKAAWSSHKSVHTKAQLSSIAKSLPSDQNSDVISQGWMYFVKKRRTPKFPHFYWTVPLKQYPISTKRFPADINRPDWTVDIYTYHSNNLDREL